MSADMKRFLFEYPFNGETYCLEIPADSAGEAQERIRALPWAQYKGEIFVTIPMKPPGWLRRWFPLATPQAPAQTEGE